MCLYDFFFVVWVSGVEVFMWCFLMCIGESFFFWFLGCVFFNLILVCFEKKKLLGLS